MVIHLAKLMEIMERPAGDKIEVRLKSGLKYKGFLVGVEYGPKNEATLAMDGPPGRNVTATFRIDSIEEIVE